MVTIYDLLEVSENASKEEIEKSYQNLVIEYQTNPILSAEENKKNELILNKLKIAYEILVNDDKRKKYDRDLSKKRAEELIKNISNNGANASTNASTNANTNASTNYSINDSANYSINNGVNYINNDMSENGLNNSINKDSSVNYDDIPKAKNTREKITFQEEETNLSKEEKKKIRKAARREFNENLKKVQKVEEEYNNAYNEAYRKYMRKMGYDVKEPLTLKKVRNTLIVIIVFIFIGLISWIIPPVRKLMLNIYENNVIIKSFVDIINAIIKSFVSFFE